MLSIQTRLRAGGSDHDEAADDGARPPERVDQGAGEQHEAVHADDVRAHDREQVVLVVTVADHDVAAQVHQGDHDGEAGQRGRGAAARTAKDRGERRGGGRRDGRTAAERIGDLLRIGTDVEHDGEPEQEQGGRHEPRHDERVGLQVLPGEERREDRRTERGPEHRAEQDERDPPRRAARADTCRRRPRGSGRWCRCRCRAGRNRRSRAGRPGGAQRGDASSGGATANPPASTGIRPTRSIARPAGRAASAPVARIRAGPSPSSPSTPVTTTKVIVATASTVGPCRAGRPCPRRGARCCGGSERTQPRPKDRRHRIRPSRKCCAPPWEGWRM